MTKRPRQPVDHPVAFYKVDLRQRTMIKVFSDGSKLFYSVDGMICGWDESQSHYRLLEQPLLVRVKPRRFGKRFLSYWGCRQA